MRSTTSSNRRRSTGKPPAKHPRATGKPPADSPQVAAHTPRCSPFPETVKETIPLAVSKADNWKRCEAIEVRLTPEEHRDFKKLARNIGQSQLCRLLITQAIAKAKAGGLQIELTL